MEKRKHVSQMTNTEKEVLITLVTCKKFRNSHHLNIKKTKRDIKDWQINKAIREGTLIEYHYVKPSSQRVLLRRDFPERNLSLCVVVDLIVGDIITAYYNPIEDNHYTINMTKYDRRTNIYKLLFQGGE